MANILDFGGAIVAFLIWFLYSVVFAVVLLDGARMLAWFIRKRYGLGKRVPDDFDKHPYDTGGQPAL
jgi:hypothetical protein